MTAIQDLVVPTVAMVRSARRRMSVRTVAHASKCYVASNLKGFPFRSFLLL